MQYNFKNNGRRTQDGCFSFHRVANAKESRICERLQAPQRLTCSQPRNAITVGR